MRVGSSKNHTDDREPETVVFLLLLLLFFPVYMLPQLFVYMLESISLTKIL